MIPARACHLLCKPQIRLHILCILCIGSLLVHAAELLFIHQQYSHTALTTPLKPLYLEFIVRHLHHTTTYFTPPIQPAATTQQQSTLLLLLPEG